MAERPRPGLATQAALAMAVVVAVALLLTGVLAVQLVGAAARSQALDTLDRQAQIVANVADRVPAVQLAPNRFPSRAVFTRQQIKLVGITPDGAAHGAARAALSPADLSGVVAGNPLRGVRQLDGASVLVAAYPVQGGGGMALVQPASVAQGVGASARRRILAALLVGLAGAVIVAFGLSRRLARPLQHAAAAAHQLAGGRRDVRLQPQGPAEVAELAEALNALAAALATSESRQRGFLLSVSHELRTPLTTVKGFAEALADGVVPAPEVPAAGRTMLTEATRLDRLVADLLDLARLGAADFRLDVAPADLAEVLDAAAAAWRPRAVAAGVDLRVERPAEPVWAMTDATRVRQILDGLADNALRVTSTGEPVVLAVRPEGELVTLEVRDGGPGLTDEDLAVAFERSALHDRYRGVRRVGAGVGLALVAGLAVRLGGRPEAGHAPEGGARFTVRLPRTAPPVQ